MGATNLNSAPKFSQDKVLQMKSSIFEQKLFDNSF